MPLAEQIWDKILRELESGNCCLFLGPEIRCLTNAGAPISVIEAFSDYIASIGGIDYQTSNFYYRANKFINNRYRQRTFLFEDQIKAFAESYLENPPDFFSDLVQLPFNSFISMNPDEFVSRALEVNGYDFIDDFYNYSNGEKHELAITDKMRLVYYLYGKYSQAASVPVTEKARLQLVKSLVQGNPPVPASIIKRFSDLKKSFLFLGVDFNDWQLRVILDALNIPKPAMSVAHKILDDQDVKIPNGQDVKIPNDQDVAFLTNMSVAHKIPIDQDVAFLTKEFYKDTFGFGFIDADMQTFLKELISRYEKRNGPLKQRKKVVLDFHPRDGEKFTECISQLQQNGISQRVDFWDVSKAIGGGVSAETMLEEELQTADVYIPFLSSYFLNEKRQRLVNTIHAGTQVIAIHAGPVGFGAIPNISKALILPDKDTFLSKYRTPGELSEACLTLARSINASIK